MKIDSNAGVYKLLNGRILNRVEFISYFEKKVFKTIRTYELLDPKDKIVCAVSGGKDSITVLYLVHKYLKRKNLHKNIVALAIDEGIKNYREKTLEFLRVFCKEHEIELSISSYKELFGTSQDENVKALKAKELNISPCNICGTYRRNALNVGARKLKATKVVTGHNMDDEAQSILLNIFKNNFKILTRLGPTTGIVSDEKFIARVKPLYLCTEKEVKLYTILKGFDLGYDECPYAKGSFRANLGDMLNELEDNHKGVKNSIINFYLETQDSLKEKYLKDFGKTVAYCNSCGEPSQRPVCNTCQMKEIVGPKE